MGVCVCVCVREGGAGVWTAGSRSGPVGVNIHMFTGLSDDIYEGEEYIHMYMGLSV